MMEPRPASSGDAASCEQAVVERLIAAGRLTPQNLERAMRVKRERGDVALHHLLTMLGIVTEREIAETLAEVLGIPLILARDFPSVPVLEGKVNQLFLAEMHVLPLSEEADGIALAMADPTNNLASTAIRLRTGKPVLPRVAVSSEIDNAIERLYGGSNRARTIDGAESEAGADGA